MITLTWSYKIQKRSQLTSVINRSYGLDKLLTVTQDVTIHDIQIENNEVLGCIVLQVINTKPRDVLIIFWVLCNSLKKSSRYFILGKVLLALVM